MRFVEVVKHYPGQQQVNLSVEIEVPGSWFGGTEMGSLNASERRQKYRAQCSRVCGSSRISGRFIAGSQGQGSSHPVHLHRRCSIGSEFRRVLDEAVAVAVEPVPP